MLYRFSSCILLLSCLGCEAEQPEALGTLEWDRVNSRAVASEVITGISVKQGELVSTGALLLQLDNRKVLAEQNEVQASLEEAEWFLKELEAGPRPETIAEARARVAAATAVLANARIIYERREELYAGNFVSQEQRDIAKKDFVDSQSLLMERKEALGRLLAGSREEQIAQARARVRGLQSRLQQLSLRLADYRITASRNGRVDSLPFKLGDRPREGAVLATLLSGNQPWARVYVPEPYRSTLTPGQNYQLRIDGQPDSYSAKLRTISAEASFTPYFALSEKDRSRLSFVAELDLIGEKGASLTAGTPVQLILEKQ